MKMTYKMAAAAVVLGGAALLGSANASAGVVGPFSALQAITEGEGGIELASHRRRCHRHCWRGHWGKKRCRWVCHRRHH